MAHKTLISGTAYSVTGGRELIGGTGYSIKKGRTLIDGAGYDITFAPPYDSVFANNTWKQIIEACHNNAVPDTWNVADQKPMTINGVDYQIDIIGKNHDTYTAGGKAPLTFQLHDCYADTKAMSSSNTNSGGWKNSAMRTTHLPAILALMPTEVQNGIREVNKLTSAGNKSSTINTTADKLFLLSDVEIFGSTNHSAAGEGTQYDYYKAGNSKVKNRNGFAANWWERSPNASNSTNFCLVNSNGNANNNNASNANGVAFGFCTARSDAVTAGRRRSSTYAEGELIPGKSQNNPPVQTAGRCLHGRPMCAGLFHSRTATRVERAPDNHPLRRVPERARRRTIHDKRRAKRGPVSKTLRQAGSKTPGQERSVRQL